MHQTTDGVATQSGAVFRTGMFASLRIRDFRLLWVSNLAAAFSMQMETVARGWLIYDMTGSPLDLTWVMLAYMLPVLVFSLAGGVMADRMRKKSIMVTSQLLNGFATILLAYIIYSGDVTFTHFIYFGLFNGTVMSLGMPARSAVIPEIVGEGSIVNAMALQSATYTLSRILGPVAAGGFMAYLAGGDTSSTLGVGIVFYVIAMLYIGSAIVTGLLHYTGDPSRSETTGMIADVVEGFRYLRHERIIVGLLIMGFLPMTFGYNVMFLLPVFNVDVLGGGPDDLSFLVAAMGVGALVGSLVLARLGDIGNKGRVLFVAAYFWAAFLLGFAISETLWSAMLFGIFAGLFGTAMGSLNMSVVQLASRPEIRGRVMAIMWMTYGFMPLGLIPISWLAEVVSIETALLVSGILLAATMALLGIFYPELKTIDKGHGKEESVSDTRAASDVDQTLEGR
jgi:MFS family permease